VTGLASSGGNALGIGLTLFIVVLGLAWTVFLVWLAVIAIQFGRSGTRAFRRYVEVTPPPAPAPAPLPVRQRGGDSLT
jgi:hypothetical protein